MNEDPDYQKLVTIIGEQIGVLHRRALDEYLPVVEQIVASGSSDIRHIEQTLDGLLDFCGHDALLSLYRRLCRHCYDFDPAAAVSYVNAYREMWNSESELFSEGQE